MTAHEGDIWVLFASESLRVLFGRAALCGGRDSGGRRRYCSLDLQSEKTVMEPGLSSCVLHILQIMRMNIDGSEAKIGKDTPAALTRLSNLTVESIPGRSKYQYLWKCG